MLKLHPKKHSYKLFYFFIWQYQFVEEMQPFLNRCPQIHGCYIIKTGKGCTSLFRLNTCTGTTKSIVEHRQFSKWGKKFYRFFFFQSKHTSYIGGKVHVELGWITQSILSTIYLYTWGLSSCNLPQYCTNWYQTLKCIIKCMPLFLFIFEEKPWAPYYLGGKFLAKRFLIKFTCKIKMCILFT